jgi:hypothetical protein
MAGDVNRMTGSVVLFLPRSLKPLPMRPGAGCCVSLDCAGGSVTAKMMAAGLENQCNILAMSFARDRKPTWVSYQCCC